MRSYLTGVALFPLDFFVRLMFSMLLYTDASAFASYRYPLPQRKLTVMIDEYRHVLGSYTC